ncbi:MAG TPA: hypothetical protein VGE85_07600 [Terracidiphilus sp.]
MKAKPSFLRRHRKALSLIGALIVFLTFVLKDTKQQHLRDEIDDLKGARRSLMVLMEVFRVEIGEAPIKDYSKHIHVHSIREAMEYRVMVYGELARLTDRSQRFGPTIFAMLDVGLFSVHSVNLSLDEWESTSTALLDKERLIHAQVGKLANVPLAEQSARLNKAFEEIDECKDREWELHQALLQHASELSAFALFRQSHLSDVYANYEYGGYLFYFVGWSLAFMGKLLGDDS